MDRYEILCSMDEKENLTEEDLNMLIEFSNDDDEEIRGYVAELAGREKNENMKKLLVSLSKDDDEMVRASAYDSLGEFADKEILDYIFNKFDEEDSEIAMVYIISSVTDILSKVDVEKCDYIGYFEECLQDKFPEDIYIAIFKMLVKFGENKYLPELVKFLNDKDYYNRKFAIEALGELIDKENKKFILRCLKERKNKEKIAFVKDEIEEILKENEA